MNKREEHQEISTVNLDISTAAAAATTTKRTTQIAKSKGTANNSDFICIQSSTNTYMKTWACACMLFVRMTVVRIAVHRIQNQKKKQNENENKNIENRKTKSEIPILSNPIWMYPSKGNSKCTLTIVCAMCHIYIECWLHIDWNVKWEVWALFAYFDWYVRIVFVRRCIVCVQFVYFNFRHNECVLVFYYTLYAGVFVCVSMMENVCVFVCGLVWYRFAYLECGINNGEPIDGGGIVGVGSNAALLTAAVSGCKKFRRCSTRSWCCVRHRVINSGSASNRSCNNGKFNNKIVEITHKNIYGLIQMNDVR